MPLYLANRKDTRRQFADILKGVLTTVDADAIYPYQATNIEGQSPVIRIMNSGSARPKMTFKGSSSTFSYTLQILTVFEIDKGQSDGSDWTPADAEDSMDDVEHELSTILLNGSLVGQTGFRSIERLPSTVRKDIVQGETYLIELVPIIIEARDPGVQRE